jgi:hypothetical protein
MLRDLDRSTLRPRLGISQPAVSWAIIDQGTGRRVIDRSKGRTRHLSQLEVTINAELTT